MDPRCISNRFSHYQKGTKKERKTSGRETHAIFDLGIKILSDHTTLPCNPHLRQASVILFRHVSFWGDGPAEIFNFSDTPPLFGQI
jgi:hypothetical protein